MSSLRQAATCVGISGTFSVMSDFFGLMTGKVPQGAGASIVLSVQDQIRALQGSHFHINVILVGSDLFTSSDRVEVDFAVHKARAIYGQVGVGVGRVLHFAIPAALADGREVIDSDDEAADLTNEWTVHNAGLDVFIVRDYTGSTIGRSDVDGNCDKDNSGKMTGSVVEISNGTQQTARSFAHEIGHYLGLGHENEEPDNLMCQSSGASSITSSVKLTSDQGDDIKEHCVMQPAC
jgi:hypothetical protein